MCNCEKACSCNSTTSSSGGLLDFIERAAVVWGTLGLVDPDDNDDDDE